MLANRSKSIIGWCLLGILLCIIGVTVLTRNEKMTSCYNSRPPLRRINVNIDLSQSQQLIEQAKKFASKHSFEFQIAYYTPTGTNFSIWMKRKDVELIIWNTIVDPDNFDANFYNNDCIHPTAASDIDGLVNDLKIFISELPSAKITEEK